MVPWGGRWGSRIGPGAMHSSDHFYPMISLLVIPDDEDDDDDDDGDDDGDGDDDDADDDAEYADDS